MNFYFYGLKHDPVWVTHESICLAEGLCSLQHNCYGDAERLRHTPDALPLIRYNPDIRPQNCDAVILSSQISVYADVKKELGNLFSQIGTHIPVFFIDEADGLRTPGFLRAAGKCHKVLKSHFNRKMKYPANFVPWQFGVAQRHIDYIQALPVTERNTSLLVNFRVRHQLRDYMNRLCLPILSSSLDIDNTVDGNRPESFTEKDRFLYAQSRGRHNPAYYERLPHGLFSAAYGGVFCLPFGNHDKYTAKLVRMVNDTLPLFRYDRIRQWDSWRFWESLLAGCITLHVDLETFGCLMPVMPVNYRDYIGIDPYHPEIFREWVESAMGEWENGDPQMLRSLSDNARNFVLNNYRPIHVAQRLLEMF